MKDLITKLYTLFTALTGGVHNSFYTAVNGRFYESLAPENTEYPYAVHSVINMNRALTFTTTDDDVLWQISLFDISSSSATIKDIFGYVISLYEQATLSLAAGTLVSCRLENASGFIRDEDGVWQVDLEFRILKTE